MALRNFPASNESSYRSFFLSQNVTAMSNLKKQKTQVGFTLVEVLVVVSIIVILTTLLIPRLRTINKERGLREAARVTGSIFAQASQRAITDGVAGVLLQKNPNFADGNGYSYAVSSMSLLRAVTNFTGDQRPGVGVGAYNESGEIRIPFPIEQPDLEIIKVGDLISFGHSSQEYRITSLTPEPLTSPTELTVEVDLQGFLPNPISLLEDSKTEIGTAYVVRRLPRPLRSSEVSLPQNYLVDLRFSGFTTLDSGYLPLPDNSTRPARATVVFEPNPRLPNAFGPVADFSASDIAILFNTDGAIDRMVMLNKFDHDLNPATPDQTFIFERLVTDNLNLMVTDVKTDVDADTDPADNPLNSETDLWVNVNRVSGTANVGYNNALGGASNATVAYTNTAGGTSTSDTLTNLEQLDGFYNNPDPNQRLRFNAIVGAARSQSVNATAQQ